jgi:transposase
MKHLSHKIRIYPNNAIATRLAMCFGVARFVYNWGLQHCKQGHDRDINAAINILNEAAGGYREAQNACGEGVRRGGRKATLLLSEKQEDGIRC